MDIKGLLELLRETAEARHVAEERDAYPYHDAFEFANCSSAPCVRVLTLLNGPPMENGDIFRDAKGNLCVCLVVGRNEPHWRRRTKLCAREGGAVRECRVTKPADYPVNATVCSTEGSCEWMKRVTAVWGGCEASIDFGNGFHLSSCDSMDIQDHPITYCPGCGGKLVLVEPKREG